MNILKCRSLNIIRKLVYLLAVWTDSAIAIESINLRDIFIRQIEIPDIKVLDDSALGHRFGNSNATTLYLIF